MINIFFMLSIVLNSCGTQVKIFYQLGLFYSEEFSCTVRPNSLIGKDKPNHRGEHEVKVLHLSNGVITPS